MTSGNSNSNKTQTNSLEESPHQKPAVLVSDLRSPRTVRNKFMLSISHPVYGIVLWLIRQCPSVKSNFQWKTKVWTVSSIFSIADLWMHSPEEGIWTDYHNVYYRWPLLIVLRSNQWFPCSRIHSLLKSMFKYIPISTMI
jgi:hypothetical protein